MKSWTSIFVVNTPAASQDLTCLEVVKDELQISDESSDKSISRWITEVSASIRGYTRRTFIVEGVTETFFRGNPPPFAFGGSWTPPMVTGWYERFDNPETLKLKRFPVVNPIGTVTEDGTVLVENTDFSVDYETGLLYRLDPTDPSFPASHVRWTSTIISVVYNAGFATLADIPGEVSAAAVKMVTHRYTSRGRDPALRSIDVQGVQSESYWTGGSGLSLEITDLLDAVRDYRLTT